MPKSTLLTAAQRKEFGLDDEIEDRENIEIRGERLIRHGNAGWHHAHNTYMASVAREELDADDIAELQRIKRLYYDREDVLRRMYKRALKRMYAEKAERRNAEAAAIRDELAKKTPTEIAEILKETDSE